MTIVILSDHGNIYIDKINSKRIQVRAFYGYYIGMYPDNSIQVFRPEDFHSLYTLKL